MEILILGAGVVGTTTAYQLLKDGHHVNIIDRKAPAIGGASFGNAGLIASGHTMAWASPKALKILKSCFVTSCKLLFLFVLIILFYLRNAIFYILLYSSCRYIFLKQVDETFTQF